MSSTLVDRAVIVDQLQKSANTNFNVRDASSVFGEVVRNLGFRNVPVNRFYVYNIWKSNMCNPDSSGSSNNESQNDCSLAASVLPESTDIAQATELHASDTEAVIGLGTNDAASDVSHEACSEIHCDGSSGFEQDVFRDTDQHVMGDVHRSPIDDVNRGSKNGSGSAVAATSVLLNSTDIGKHTQLFASDNEAVIGCGTDDAASEVSREACSEVWRDERLAVEQDVFTETVVHVPAATWRTIRPCVKSGKLVLTAAWRNYLLEQLSQLCHCVLSFGYSRVSKPKSRKQKCPFVRQNATCTFDNCRSFSFLVDKKQDELSAVKLRIILKGVENHPANQSKFRRTTEQEFDSIAESLAHKQPEEVYDELLAKADTEKLLHGNFNEPKSPSVLRRIKSVLNQREKLHKNVTVELDVMQQLYADCDTESTVVKGYIQHRGANPFYVTLYTEKQLQLLCDLPLVLHLDATGSIFKSIEGLRCRLLLYSLILPSKVSSEPPVAIAEMIASRHNTEIISHFLLCVRMDLNRLCQKPLTNSFVGNLVVTDFSWVLIHAVLHELNDALDIHCYLRNTYAALVDGERWSTCTGVFLCVNHVIHIVAKKTAKMLAGNADVRDVFMHCFVSVQYSTTFSQASKTVRNMFVLFGLPNSNSLVRAVKKQLVQNFRKCHVKKKYESVLYTECEYKFGFRKEKEEKRLRKGSGIRGNSPWKNYFTALHDEVMTEGNDDRKKKSSTANRFYSPDLLKYFIGHWLPLFPLWCMAIAQLFNVTCSKSWFTNANVENWFAYVKQRHLRTSGTGCRIRAGKFIQKQRVNIVNRLKRFRLFDARGIPTAVKKRKRVSDAIHDVEERYGKKKRRAKYVNSRLNKATTVLEGSLSKSEDSDGMQEVFNSVVSPDTSPETKQKVSTHKLTSDKTSTANVSQNVPNSIEQNSEHPTQNSQTFLTPQHQGQDNTIRCQLIPLPSFVSRTPCLHDSPYENSQLVFVPNSPEDCSVVKQQVNSFQTTVPETPPSNRNIAFADYTCQKDALNISMKTQIDIEDNSLSGMSISSLSSLPSSIGPTWLCSNSMRDSSSTNVCSSVLELPKKDSTKSTAREFNTDHALIMVLRTGHVILEYHMRSILTEGEWLQADVITSFLTCYQSQSFIAWGGNIWRLIEQQTADADTVASTNWSAVKNIVTWKNENGHFVLIWICVTSRFVAYINTIQEAYDRESKALAITRTWNSFATAHLTDKLGTKAFTSRNVKHHYQQDSSSCGVLACMLGMCIATDKSPLTVRTDTRAIARHRDFIWKILVANKATNLCAVCRKQNDPGNEAGCHDRWVRCESCGNWMHFSCAKLDYNMPVGDVAVMAWRCTFCR